MKFPKFCSFALVLLTINSAYAAERRLVMMGGGGEPKNINTTIFDQSLNTLDGYLEKNKWGQVVLSFNGGHSQTEAIMNMKFADATTKTNFTPNNYNAIIKNYEEQIKKGELKSGDQLLLMINTHGAKKGDDVDTHKIAVGAGASQTNLNDLGGTTLVSMDAMKNLAALAKEKGIKLAIVDFSCHSGNSLALANENTCVISSSGKNHFGYNTFSDNFIGKMKAGKSLEDVFLDTRKSTTDNSYPMISSPEGETINQEIYPNITPYLYYYEEDSRIDKMTSYLLEASSNAGLCARQNQYEQLEKQLESLKAASALNMNKSIPEIAKIKKLIAAYKEKQDNYINLVRSWGLNELDHHENFSATAKVGKKTYTMPGSFTWKELVESDFDNIIRNVSYAKRSAKDPATQAQFQASIDMHTKAKVKQMDILAKYPNLKDYKEKFKEQLVEMKGTYAIANQIAMEERKLYHTMYSNLRNEKNQKNACKDFVL